MPAYNEEKIIQAKISQIKEYFSGADHCINVVIVENGSTDDTFNTAQKFSEVSSNLKISVIKSDKKGIGHAYFAGYQEIIKKNENPMDIIILSAMDLPFGFSDLEGFLNLRGGGDIIIGSKGHPKSQLQNTLVRNILSAVFYYLRFLILTLKVRDTQGTFFIPLKWARQIFPEIRSRDFFFSTELCYKATRHGGRFVEVPIVLEKSQRPSSVKVFRDSLKMLIQLIQLKLDL